MAHRHDQEAAAALFLRRTPVVGRVALRAGPVAAVLELLRHDVDAGDGAEHAGVDELPWP